MRRALGFLVFALLLGGAVWLGLTSSHQPEPGEHLERFGLADDIPIPWDRFHDAVGVGGDPPLFHLRPLAKDLFAEGPRLLEYFRQAMPADGWELMNEELAGDGAWTAGWTKGRRDVRLTFGPELRGEQVSLIVEQCPPASVGTCGPSTLHPMVGS